VWASTIASVANSVQITITNVLYQKFALYLTELENPRYWLYDLDQ
jgi:Uma2 family endonuclease